MANEKILLIGGYGVGNYGDESILAGLINELPPNSKKTAVSHDPKETSKLHGINAIHPIEALKALKEYNLAIISGGIFGGHIGTWGKLIPVFCILSNSMGINIEFRGLGAYPSTPKYMWPLIKASAKIAKNISVRDKLSKVVLTEMGINNVHLVQDLSFSMPAAPRKRAIEILEKEGVDLSRRIIGISITRTNPAIAKKVTATVRRFIKRFINESEILFIPICRHKKSRIENDLLYSIEVAQGLPAVKILQGSYHPSEILSIFGLLESCICMRFHSMLFARRMGIDMLPIPYAEKCYDFLVNVGVTPIYTSEIIKLA